MAYEIGTATDRYDLWDRLLSFLTTNDDLVADGQNWEVVWSNDAGGLTRRTLKGTGLSGADQIYVSLCRRDDEFTLGESVIDIVGSTGVSPSALGFTDHPNSLVRYPRMFLDSGPMQYWFVANGRRFIVVVKISTIYNAMYAGLFIPYAPPGVYTYPMFIGGSRGYSAGDTSYEARTWRNATDDYYRIFVRPFASDSANNWYDSPAAMFDPTGIWRAVLASGASRFLQPCYMYPSWQQSTIGGTTINLSSASVTSAYTEYGPGYTSVRNSIVSGLDDEVACTPLTLATFNTNGNPEEPTIYGILDGCFEVGATSPSAESTFTVDGVEHIIFPNVQRTTAGTYWAIALE